MERIYNSYWYIRAMFIGCMPPVTDFHPLVPAGSSLSRSIWSYLRLLVYADKKWSKPPTDRGSGDIVWDEISPDINPL